jgi:hypothetical protein
MVVLLLVLMTAETLSAFSVPMFSRRYLIIPGTSGFVLVKLSPNPNFVEIIFATTSTDTNPNPLMSKDLFIPSRIKNILCRYNRGTTRHGLFINEKEVPRVIRAITASVAELRSLIFMKFFLFLP